MVRDIWDAHVAEDRSIQVVGVADDDCGDVYVPYQRSDDLGKTWSTPVELYAHDPPVPLVPCFIPVARTWFEYRQQGTAFAAFEVLNPPEATLGPPTISLMIGRLPYQGGHWTVRAALEGVRSAGPIRADPSSNWSYVAAQLQDGRLVLGRSPDDGQSWEAIPVLREPRGPLFWIPTVGVDAAGTVYVSWADDALALAPSDDPRLQELVARPSVKYTFSMDHGHTWSEAHTVSAPGATAIYPWLLAGDAGRVAVAWLENALGTPVERGPGTWVIKLAMSTTADSMQPTFADTIVTPSPVRIPGICPSARSDCDRSYQTSGFYEFFQADVGPGGYVNLVWPVDLVSTKQVMKIFFGRQTTGTSLLENLS